MEREMYSMPTKSIFDYWLRYWSNRTQELLKAEHFNDIAKSPRLLIENILLELKYNGFNSKDIWSLFKKELEEWRKEDVFKSLFDKECGSILSIWGTKPIIVTSICQSILAKMDNGSYYRGAIQKLVECLKLADDFSYQNKKLIHQYSDICIVELLSKGYALEDVKDAIHHPSVLMDEANNVLVAPKELCGYKYCDYHSKEEYLTALTKYFATLPIEDKVNIINFYYEKEEKDAIVLVRLTGVEGEADIFIDDINIYSLNKRQYIKDDSNYKIETPTKNHILINAAIPVKYKSKTSAIKYALNKLGSILALLEITFNTKQPISCSNDDITIVEDGKVLFQFNKFKKDNDFYRLSNYNISHLYSDFEDLSHRLATSKSFSATDFSILTNAAQWIQKAKSTEMFSDRLIFSWIAIESLIKLNKNYTDELIDNQKNYNKTTIAKKIIVPIIVHNIFHYYIQDIVYDLQSYFNRYSISEIVKKDFYKDKNEDGIPKSNIFNCLDKLKNEVKEETLRNKLEDFGHFYHRDTSGIKEFKHNIESELSLIYRFRNLIMHNAVYSTYQVKYYANRALFYAASLLDAILTLSTNYQLSISDTIIKIVLDGMLFEKDLSKEIEKLYTGK